MDALLSRLRNEPPANEDALYAKLRRILLETSNRDELKFAIVLVGAFGRPSDAEILRALARHQEFTLYAAVALGRAAEDPVGELLALLPDVSGWGATELSELPLKTEDERACAVLLRRGPAIGNALGLAVGCRLHEALEVDDVDDGLLRGAQAILDDLVWSSTGPDTLLDYPEAGPTVERFLELLAGQTATLRDLLSAHGIVRLLDVDPWGRQPSAAELAGAGFDEARLERVRARGLEIAGRADWRPLVETALESDDRSVRARGIRARTRRTPSASARSCVSLSACSTSTPWPLGLHSISSGRPSRSGRTRRRTTYSRSCRAFRGSERRSCSQRWRAPPSAPPLRTRVALALAARHPSGRGAQRGRGAPWRPRRGRSRVRRRRARRRADP